MNAIDKKINIIEKLDSLEQLDYKKINIIKNSSENIKQIDLKDNSSLTLVELFENHLENKNLNKEFVVGKNSVLVYLKLSIVDTNIRYNLKAEENSKIDIHLFDFDKNNKNTIDIKLNKKDIDLKINALVNLKNDSELFNSFNITHQYKNTYSDIKVRHLLDNNSKAEFEATTVIENEALYSKGFQDSKTILLSDDASIKARPHLEILTDELEASHGATTGGLDKDAIYYLQSRGLSNTQAISMLIEAFSNISIEQIKDEVLQEWVKNQIRGYHV